MKHFGQKRYTEGNSKYVALFFTRLLDTQWHAQDERPTNKYVVYRGALEDVKYVNSVEGWDDPTYADLTAKLKIANPEIFTDGKIIKEKELPSKSERVKVAKDYFRGKNKTTEEFTTYGMAERAYCNYCLTDCGKVRTENFGFLDNGEVYE